MMMKRREFLQAAGAGIGLLAAGRLATAAEMAPLRKSIPSSGETIPAIGMGSWVTFNVGSDQVALAQRTEVLRSFFRHGGGAGLRQFKSCFAPDWQPRFMAAPDRAQLTLAALDLIRAVRAPATPVMTLAPVSVAPPS